MDLSLEDDRLAAEMCPIVERPDPIQRTLFIDDRVQNLNPAAALGLDGYGLRDGGPADLVVFDATSEADALRLSLPLCGVVMRFARKLGRVWGSR